VNQQLAVASKQLCIPAPAVASSYASHIPAVAVRKHYTSEPARRSNTAPMKIPEGSLISGAWTNRTQKKHLFLLNDFAAFVLRTRSQSGVSQLSAHPEDGLTVTPFDIDKYLRSRRENPRAPTKTGDPVCKWSHVQGILGNLLGAIRDAPLYGHNITITDNASMIKKIDRTLRKRTNVEPVLFPQPVSLGQVRETLLTLRMKVEPLYKLAELYLILWHGTAARPQDPLALQMINIQSHRTISHHRVWSITYVEGKGVLIRGPYTVHTVLLNDSLLVAALSLKQKFLFPLQLRSRIHEIVVGALKATCPRLEQRSIRRGALQDLAMTDAEESTLLTFSGHKNAPMLWRYLGWGQRRGRAQRTGADAALAAWMTESK